ncbi:MAG: hypothetical protein JNK74_16315 [Candidatus Hydrogenedentes bacterium]|nr:hypothetical protein [Candidatus Hydrogenedentota bacterium]
MGDKGNLKGARAEEAIRNVFLHAGYYVVRALPYKFKDRDVTDIDLWLYGKSGLFRERVNVDIKNKKTPQAIERFFWALGVMHVLRLDRCIVVTTESNPAVVEFGRRSNVAVIDGQYLHDAQAMPDASRLSEEQLFSALQPIGAEELGKELLGRYHSAKARLLTHMTFDGCNLHIVDIRKCFEELIAYPGVQDAIRRVLYATLSYLAVTVDFLAVKMEFTDFERRQHTIETGFRYGTAGRNRLDEFGKVLDLCKRPDRPEDSNVISQIVKSLKVEAGNLRADIIAEFMTKQLAGYGLFKLAVQLESQAFAISCSPIVELPTELKSFVLVLADFFGIERTKVLAC